MKNKKPLSKDEQWVENYQKQTEKAKVWAIPAFLGCLCIIFYGFFLQTI